MAVAAGTCLCKRAVDAPSVFVDANIRFLSKFLQILGNARSSHSALITGYNQHRDLLPDQGGPRLGRLLETVLPRVAVPFTQDTLQTPYSTMMEDQRHGE